MDTQTVTVQLDSSTAAILRLLEEKAAAQGLTLADLLQPLADINYMHEKTFFERTPEERAHAVEEWVHLHHSSAPPLSDAAISRESIYGEREDKQL